MTASKPTTYNPRGWALMAAMGLIGLILLIVSQPKDKLANPSQSIAKTLKQSSYEDPEAIFLVNLWATWCEPCKEEIPDLIRLANSHKKLQLRLIQMDSAEKNEAGLMWLKSVGAADYALKKDSSNFNNFFFILGFDQPAALPYSFLMKNAEIIASWAGSKSFEELELELKPYFE